MMKFKLHSPLVSFLLIAWVFGLFFVSTDTANHSKRNRISESSKEGRLADSFRLSFRDGTVWVCELDDLKIDWNEVAEDGKITQSLIPLSKVNRMVFSQSTVSQQVARIKTLIDQLESLDFGERNQAEKELKKIAGPFQQILKNRKNQQNSEAKYRLNRIIQYLANERSQAQAAYDLLTLDDGRTVRGDSPSLKISGKHYGKSIKIERDLLYQIERIQADDSTAELVAGYKTYSKPIESFYQSSMRVADFEKGENEKALKANTDLTSLYVYLGCHFQCEGKGNEVKVDPYDVSGRTIRQSAVSFDYSYQNNARYKGVFRVDFCEATQQQVAATTRRVGCYLQMINPPRTIIMEAYNEDDECIGVCEAIESTSFVGLESDQGISYIRILTNKHLKMLNDAEPDNDFAVDDLAFEPTRRALTSAYEKEYSIVLKNGDALRCKSVSVNDGEITLTGISVDPDREIKIGLDQLVAFAAPENKQVERKIDHVAFARLNDGSVVGIRKLGKGALADFPSIEINSSNVAGIWGAKSVCRHAHVDDFKSNQPIVVFPAYRLILDDINLVDDRVSWDASQGEIRRQSYDTFEEVTDPKYQETYDIAESPSIWFKVPQARKKEVGMLRTRDGQRFALGGSIGFQIANWDQDSVTLKNGDEKVSIPMSQVRSLVFPQK